MDTTAEHCTIPTPTSSSPTCTLLHWASLTLQNETHLSDFADLHFTIEFIAVLFKVDKDRLPHSDSITAALAHIHALVPDVFGAVPSTVDLAAYDHGDQNQIIPLLAFIQTEHQVYHTNHFILSNPELSFTAYVQYLWESQSMVKQEIANSSYTHAHFRSISTYLYPPPIISRWRTTCSRGRPSSCPTT